MVRYLGLLFFIALPVMAEEEPEYWVEEDNGFVGFQTEAEYDRYQSQRLLIESEVSYEETREMYQNPSEWLMEYESR